MKIVDSGCIGICTLESGTCSGCGRTIAEIENWQKMDETQRIAVHTRISKDSDVLQMISQSSKRILENHSNGKEED